MTFEETVVRGLALFIAVFSVFDMLVIAGLIKERQNKREDKEQTEKKKNE